VSKIRVHLHDFAGRDFGGEFEIVGVSKQNSQYLIDLQYCGSKASKRLCTASLRVDAEIIERDLGAIAQARTNL
jgi:hypothetical protein